MFFEHDGSKIMFFEHDGPQNGSIQPRLTTKGVAEWGCIQIIIYKFVTNFKMIFEGVNWLQFHKKQI